MKTWKISDIGGFFVNTFKAILKAELVMRLHIDRYLVHICYTFLMFVLVIYLSLSIESTMAKVEKNKEILTELKIENAQKVFDLAKVSSRETVLENLEKLDSELKPAEKPAYVVR